MPQLLSRWKIGVRLQTITVVTLVTIGTILVSVYHMETSRLYSARVSLLHAIDDSAIAIMSAYHDDETAGRFTRAEAQARASAAIKAMRYQGDEYLWINGMQAMVMHPIKPELNGRDLSTIADPNGFHPFVAMVDLVRARGEGTIRYVWPRPGSNTPVPKLSYVKGFAPWGWVIGTGVYIDDLDSATSRLAISLAALGAGVSIVLGALVWWLGRSVSRPVQALTAATTSLADGDLDIIIPGQNRGDEVGSMSAALIVLRDAAVARRELQRQVEQEHANKESRRTAIERHMQDFGQTMVGVMADLTRSSASMHGTSGEMVAAVARTRQCAVATAEGARQSAMNLSAVVESSEQMSASIGEISQQIANAAGSAKDATHRVSQTDEKVQRLANAAEAIGAVVGLIADIAGQTNLLALNATIEAARAGESGKGFAVVASEVKTLASQTARATDDIRGQVAAIRLATADTVTMVSGVRHAIEQMDHIVTTIASAIEEQSAATQAIAMNANAVSVSSRDAVVAMEEVCAVAEACDATGQTLAGAAGEVSSTSSRLSEEMDGFLQAMANPTDEQRRRYERLAGNGLRATLVGGPHDGNSVVVKDISRGGAALICDWSHGAGEPMAVVLGTERGAAAGRVLRSANGVLALAFIQSEANLAVIDATLSRLEAEAKVAA
jgi:methyl-accepting chemotaxis protein